MKNTNMFRINKNGVLTSFRPEPQDNLDRVIIPEGVTEIGYNAFYDLSKEQEADMHSVVIPESVTAIRGFAFCGCSGLQDITIPDGVTTIGSGAFLRCESLTSIALPESVTKIDKEAFCNCNHLTSVTLPTHIEKISDSLFSGCVSLQSITIPESVKEIGNGAFSDCAGLQNVTIPEGIKWIYDCAFSDCTSLRSVTIPKSVKSVCKLPKGHEWLDGAYAGTFRNCTALQSVTFLGNIPEMNKFTFQNCSPALIAPRAPISGFLPVYRPGAVRGFARLYEEKAELDEEIKADYLKYIKGQKKKLYPVAVKHEELLHLMFAEKFITRKDIDLLLEECDKQQNATAKAAVMEYADKNL